MWFKLLHDGDIPSTAENLVDAAYGEHYKWTDMYENFAKDARDGDHIWGCRNCGHVVVGPAAPFVCPVCALPQAFFELKAEHY